MGRPKTPDAQRRKLRRVGMVDAEWASVREAAARCGVPASAWAAIRENCESLADMLEDEGSDEEDIHDLAARLRDTLVRMI